MRDVQTAFLARGGLPPPATGAQILARQHRPVVGHAVRLDIAPDLAVAPVCERVELLQPVHGVVFPEAQRGARRCLLAPLAGEPGALAGKRAAQRLDLADLAAALAQLDVAVKAV